MRKRHIHTSAHAVTKAARAPLALLALALVALFASTGTAAANSTMPTVIQDDPELLYGSADLRETRLDEINSLGVEIVKVRVNWRFIAPTGKKKPAGFDGNDPAAYPAGAWDRVDAVVRSARSRGLTVMFQLGGTAPDWATGGNHKSAVYKPSATEFGRFVQAVGTRYSGSYGDLPRVSIYTVWNEPNLVSWLAPQISGGVPQAPRLYRNLLRAADSGLDASGHGDADLLLGELLPFARSSREAKNKTRPIKFLREVACLDGHYRKYKGKAAKRRGCAGYKALPGTGLAYHPYTLAGGPNVRTPNKDDATISNLSRLSSALDKLRSRGRIQKSKMPIWITEFGFQSDPPDRYASPIKKIPGFMGQSEWLAFRNRRVVSYSQYPLRDDAGKVAGFQSGIRFHNGKAKPGVFNAFRHPFYARRSGSRVEFFGGVREGGSGDVTLQARKGSKGKWKTVGTASLNSRGYFDKRVKVSGAKSKQFRFTANGITSRTAKAA
jgi:hypothetical protein